MNARFEDLPPEGCHRCSTPVSDVDPSLPSPVLSDTGTAYVLLCPDCAGPEREWLQVEDESEFDAPPVDVADCWTCEGQGDVPFAHDQWGVLQYMTCKACRGTGIRGAA